MEKFNLDNEILEEYTVEKIVNNTRFFNNINKTK